MPEERPCVVCGRPTYGDWLVNLDNTTGKIIAPDAAPEHGEFGFLPVGGGCRAILIRNGVHPSWFIKED